MTEFDVFALVIEKWGLPGVIAVGLGWAMWRFGVSPTQSPAMTNETAAAIGRLSDKIDNLKDEVTDRLARAETNITNLQRGGK